MPAHRFTPEEAAPLVYFANERHFIYLLKQHRDGLPIPDWADPAAIPRGEAEGELEDRGGLTLDPILSTYRFCNVFRELDRVTVWIRENIREPFAQHEHLWFMLAIARFINWPPTLLELISGVDINSQMHDSWPSVEPGYSLEEMTAVLEARRRHCSKPKVETGAYMIRAESDPKKEWYSWSKQRYISEVVLGRPWRDRSEVTWLLDDSPRLETVWEWLVDPKSDWVGWGPFMCGQVVADLRHTRYLEDAPDVGRWAPLGPGSTRGLNRLAGRELTQSIRQEQGLDEMLQLQELVNAELTGTHVPFIELHDLQNCLCETDKYLRVKLGQGRPRAQYIPGRGY